jgi:hypothetical protein
MIALGPLQLSLADGFVERAPDPIQAFGKELVVHLSDDRFVARFCTDLSDSLTHQTTTHNTDLLYLHARLSFVRTIEPQSISEISL